MPSARRLLLVALVAVAAALAAAAHGAPAGAQPGPAAGKVSFLAGDATRAASGRSEALAVGSAVREGDVIETRRRTRLEIALADGSLLRLGPNSRVALESAAFGATPEDRKVTARLAVGAVWATVARAVGGESRFEVRTANAVAGVRGTTFRVDAARDASVVVKVYGGAVAVSAGPVPRPGQAPAKAERKQVEGPAEVTREQWERIVTSMMLVRVSAAGVPAEPEAFALAEAGKDDWEAWNRQRDAKARP
ncbi:MAG TPA: FecR family protein [Anaeromyxobacteraceae bacterium]|nr:FecR family protein [Anaeromyxobacteraceae bacterium]